MTIEIMSERKVKNETKKPWNFLTLGNAVTALRLVFGGLSVWFYLQENALIASGFFLLAAVTDFFDGKVARWRHRLNQNGISRFGELFDPLCDKLLIIPAIVVQPVLAGVVIIEIFSVFVASNVRKKRGFHFISRWSKFATFAQLSAIVFLFLAQNSEEAIALVLFIYLCSFIRAFSYVMESLKS